jgi:UDP-N-acetylglucosamine--N-acetylmuramyl-(pentapeptide) pyrophosphoryl-undecaprenol N-acetylglucosamine transferase
MAIRTVIACGGTGGHLFPGIAVAEALLARGGEALVLISEKEIDALATKGYDHLKFETLPAIAMPSIRSPKIIPFGFRFLKTLSRCKKLVGGFNADVVLGMGGFTSLAPLMAGRRRGAKTFIHESNAFPGKANRVAARSADVVLLGLEACRKHFSGKEVEVVGTPLREVMLTRPDRGEALRRFGLETDGRPTLLVMGGSQGARGLNRGVTGALDQVSEAGMQVIHLAGSLDVEETRKAYAGASVPHHVAAFSHEMEFAYAAADLAIARSGASSLAELSAFEIPTILIPYPFAADDHQTLNAKVYTEGGAAIMMKESELDARSFGGVLAEVMGDNGQRLSKMRAAMAELAVLDAAENICNSIESRCQ